MRRYSLINGNGQRYNLTDETVVFHSTTGLGFEREDTVRKIGNRWVRLNKDVRPTNVSGTITFYGDIPYLQYSEFAQFISEEPLYLEYTPEDVLYKKEVYISRLEKGEYDKTGALNCNIEFAPLSPWYREISVSTGKETSRANGFIFPATFPITWRSTESMTVEINSDSVLDSPVKITIEGPLKNPKWRHYVNGIYAARGELTYDILENNQLVIDTTTDPYRMYIETKTGEMVADVYQLSNFSVERFVHLKKGKNVISFSTSGGTEIVPVKVEARLYYDTV